MTAPSPKRSIPASDAIRFEHVSVRFGGVQALDDVSFSVGRGEVHCLAGENGSGKSTLIKVIAGVYQAAPGARTDYFGESVAAPTPQLARAKGVAVIWQDLALFPEMTVAENIAFDGLVGAPRLVNYRAMRETARAALAKLGVELNLSVAPQQVCPFPADNWWRLRARSRAMRSSSSWTSPPPRSRRPRRTTCSRSCVPSPRPASPWSS